MRQSSRMVISVVAAAQAIFCVLLMEVSAQCNDVYNNLPPAPVFSTTQYSAASTPPLSSLVTDHWSEVAKMYRPARIIPSANPSQTNCPHLTGSFVSFHSLGYTAGADIVLPQNTRVLVHSCSIPAGTVFGVITIPPTTELIFGDAVINFQAKGIRVLGKLLAGSETCRLRNKVTITLHGSRSEIPIEAWTKGIQVVNATIEVHGVQYTPTWTRLARTILPGDTIMFVQDMVNWEVGQTVLVTTTELKDSRDYNRNDERIIAAVYSTIYPNVAAIQVTQPFSFKHFAGKAYQAEVALLSRRVIIQGDETNSEPTDTENPICYDDGESTYPCNDKYLTGFGAHVRIEGPLSTGRFSGVEWFRVGQTNVLGKYPVHFHMCQQSVPWGRLFVVDSSVHRSYFRAYAVHGTNNVLINENVAFDVIGHAYFLEDGVEENSTFSYNLGSHIHWLGDSQRHSASGNFYSQGLFWVNENPNMILPSDSGAGVFYITNAYNRFVGNTASGGWAGFAFPNLPRAVKLHQTYRNGKFTPMSRPTLEFKGNVAHSTGYWFASSGGFYVGGTLKHPSLDAPLTYTAGRDGGRSTCAFDPLDSANGQGDGNCKPQNERWMVFEDTKIFLANRGAQHWGSRSEVLRSEMHDLGLSMNVFGRVYITNMLVQCRSMEHIPQTTCPSKNCNSRDNQFWNSFAGFQWYDVFQNHIITKSEFRNCDKSYPLCTCSRASVFTALTHSNQFVPEIMQSTREIKFTGCNPDATLQISVDQNVKQTVSGRLTNWIDQDGSIFPDAYPGQPVILGSRWANNWWKTSNACMGPKNDVWICPKNADSVASLYVGFDPAVEALIGSDVNNCPNGAGQCQIVGNATHFGWALEDGLPVAANPKITGPIIKSSGGWYIKFIAGTPKVVQIKSVMVHPDDTLILAFPYPRGTTFQVVAYAPSWCSTSWARCQDTLVPASSLDEVKQAFGDKYYYDGDAQVLYYRAVQTGDITWPSNSPDTPHVPWAKRTLSSLAQFTRDGITLMVMDAWQFRVEIQASNCGTGDSAKYCAKVDHPVPPAFGVAPPTIPNTFAPTILRTKTPTTLSPTSSTCVRMYEQCGGGGPNPWSTCCFPNQECVKDNEWWSSCQACKKLGDLCSWMSGTTRITRCCERNFQCVPDPANVVNSKCVATAAPVGTPSITKSPTPPVTNIPTPPTGVPTTSTPSPTTRSPTSVTAAPTAATQAPNTRSPTLPTAAPTVATQSPASSSPTSATTAPTATTQSPSTKAPSQPTAAPTVATQSPVTKSPTLATAAPTVATQSPVSKSPTLATAAPTVATQAPVSNSPTLATAAPTAATQSPVSKSPTLPTAAPTVATQSPVSKSPTLATAAPTVATQSPVSKSPTLATAAPTVATQSPVSKSPTMATAVPTVATQSPVSNSPTLATAAPTAATQSPVTRSPTLETAVPTVATQSPVSNSPTLATAAPTIITQSPTRATVAPAPLVPADAPSTGPSQNVATGKPSTARPTTRQPSTRSPISTRSPSAFPSRSPSKFPTKFPTKARRQRN